MSFRWAGELLGAPLNLASSSALAARLQLALVPRSGNTFSLAAVPALIPLTFRTKSEINTIKSLIRLVRDYEAVYLGRGPTSDCGGTRRYSV